MELLVTLALLGVGLLAAAKPQVVWTLWEGWKSSEGAEPSDFYLAATRISGVVAVITGVALLVIRMGV